MPPEPDPPLGGYVVIDMSSGIAGAYCTKLLADGGAEVIKVEPPEGDPLRGWSASGAEIPDGADGALFSFLACSKRSVIAAPVADDAFVDALLAGAHAADGAVAERRRRDAVHGRVVSCAVLHDAGFGSPGAGARHRQTDIFRHGGAERRRRQQCARMAQENRC